LPAAPFVVVLERAAHAAARYALQVLDRGVKAAALGAARCSLEMLCRGATAAARSAARCAPQLLDRGAQAAARSIATLPLQEKNTTAYVRRSTLNIAGFICKVAR
jgi:hypothetical protein